MSMRTSREPVQAHAARPKEYTMARRLLVIWLSLFLLLAASGTSGASSGSSGAQDTDSP